MRPPSRLTDEELTALSPVDRERLLVSRRLREEHSADVLAAALYGRLHDEGCPAEAAALRLLLAGRRRPS